MSSDEYVNPGGPPAPQLTREQLADLDPDAIVRADALGQLQAVKEGRSPTEHERQGLRWATDEERAAQADLDAAEAEARRAEVRAQLTDGLRAMRD